MQKPSVDKIKLISRRLFIIFVTRDLHITLTYVIKANFSQIESRGNAGTEVNWKYLLLLEEGTVARSSKSKLHLLCKTQSLSVVQP